MGNFETLRVRLRELLPELKARYGVSALWAFGSYPRGQANLQSDLDLLVEFEGRMGLFKFIEMEHFIGDQLGLRVDLVQRSALHPAIKASVEAEKVAV